jgi:putative ABC transport system permease protein
MFKFFQYNIRSFRNAKMQFRVALLGLVLGWSCFISISMVLYKEMTFDRFHHNYKQIYRVDYNEKTAEIPGHRHMATVGPTVGPELKASFPEVEAFVRFRYSPDWVVRFKTVRFYENSVWYADSSVFNVFDFPLKEGNAPTALVLPNSVVITQDIAKKYFGNAAAIGKTLTMNNEEYKVTGVLADIPSNSHIRFDFLLPFHAFRVPFGYPTNLHDWGWIAFYNYILLKPNSNVQSVDTRLAQLVRQHFPPGSTRRFRFELEPLKDIYFGDARDEKIAEGNKSYLLVLTLSAAMIILAASFNFANLFSAMSIVRAREMGVRKLLGAGRKSLYLHINSAAFLIVFFTLIISILLLPLWVRFAPWSRTAGNFSAYEYVAGFLVLLIIASVIALAAGLYPSLVLSGYDFQSLLKGLFRFSRKGIFLRKFMLVGQFIISIALLCSVGFISRQMNYLKKMDTGFAKDELMLIHLPGEEVAPRFGSLRDRLIKNPNITGVSLGGGRLDGTNGDVPIITEGTPPTGEPMNILSVSFDFFKTAGIRIISGKEFTKEHAYDTSRGVILNESAVKALGLNPESAIGKMITVGDILLHGEVMGVVKDFNFSSLHKPVTPLVMYYPKSRIEDIYVRFKSPDYSRIVSSVSDDWNSVLPSLPFDFQFMDDNLAGLYRTDEEFEVMFKFFSVVAISIACLGFFGLLSQDVIYRIKEIAIRKVLGADSSGISYLLLKQYLLLFTLANLIAWPMSYYFMVEWLNEFPYRATIQWFIFPAASLVFLCLSVLSVSYLTRKAATANPVSTLKA